MNLAKAVKVQQEGGGKSGEDGWCPLPVERFLDNDPESRASKIVVARKQYTSLFVGNNNYEDG